MSSLDFNIDRLVALIKSLEGFPQRGGRGFAYDDKGPWPRVPVARTSCYLAASTGQYKVRTTGGTVTIGYGETSAEYLNRYWDSGITEAEAVALLRVRAKWFADGVARCIQRPMTGHQHEAMACRAYQTGVGGFCRSEVARRFNDGDIAGAVEAWKRSFPHPKRSEAEVAHFRSGVQEELGHDEIILLFWHEGGLYLAWEGRRSNWGLLPETCDALLSTNDVRIIGTHGRPSELMGFLSPFTPANGRPSSDSQQGYRFSEEEAAALMERV